MGWSDGPQGNWWQRRYCRRGGFALLVSAVVVFAIGVEAGSDAAKDLQGRSTPGGSLEVSITCGAGGFGLEADPVCEDPNNLAQLLDDSGRVVAEARPSPFGNLYVDSGGATARMSLLVTVGDAQWTRDYYVPDGTSVEHSMHVATMDIDAASPTGNHVIGESRTGHLLAGVGALLAVGAAIGAVCAMLMTRFAWAWTGPMLLVAAAVFTAASTAAGLLVLLPALLQLVFVRMAIDEFRPQPSGEASVLLE